MSPYTKSLAWFMGATGCLPFVFPVLFWPLAGAAEQATLALMFTAYSAIILSFLGGVHWGVAMDADNAPQLAVSVLPALAAWSTILLPLAPRIAALGLLYVGWLLAELALGLPRPYARLRLVITMVVVALHFAFWWQIT